MPNPVRASEKDIEIVALGGVPTSAPREKNLHVVTTGAGPTLAPDEKVLDVVHPTDVPNPATLQAGAAQAVIAEALAASVQPLAETIATDARLEDTRLLALDVDGVLTDGRIVYGSSAPVDERQAFHVQDGIAIQWLLRSGITVAWITGRGCAATAHRARELGVDELHTQVASKGETLRAIQARLGIDRRATAAMGDDLPDLALCAAAGFFAAPANAVLEVKERAHLVTRAGGGAGAVRELAEHILRAQGRWQAIIEAAER